MLIALHFLGEEGTNEAESSVGCEDKWASQVRECTRSIDSYTHDRDRLHFTSCIHLAVSPNSKTTAEEKKSVRC